MLFNWLSIKMVFMASVMAVNVPFRNAYLFSKSEKNVWLVN